MADGFSRYDVAFVRRNDALSDAHPATAVPSPPGFADSPAAVETIDALVHQLTDAQAAITGVRPPLPALAATNDSYLARQGAVKGRPPVSRHGDSDE